ncbi:MAG TPA: DUF6220 domain-containing protein [Pseudonocardiaceae bacterium]|jgi:hypothetical protein
MRKVFLVTSALTLLAVIAQFYFAGVGVFHRPFDREGFDLHAVNAIVVQGTALLTAIAAGLARAGRRTVLLALSIILLVELQRLIFPIAGLFLPAGTTFDADGIPLVSEGLPNFVVALHVLNALVILWVVVVLFRRARRHAAAPTTPAPAAAARVAPVAGQ